MGASFKYWAFISYSHRDNRKDGNLWGDWLHDSVENFKVPPELVGRPGRYDEPVPDRLYPAFQDEKELPTNADLGMAIHQALEQSRYLVVICSPRSAKSIYVNEEILQFKRLGRANRILAIIIDGEPNASEPGKGFDPALECFPEALRHPLGADGKLDLAQHAEPIAADVRGANGREASLKDKAHQTVLEREKLRVMAGLLGVGFDDLVQRDKERQLREERARGQRLRRLVAAFAVLAAVAVTAGVIAFIQRHQADQQRHEAVRQKNEAVQTLARSDFLQAVQLVNQKKENDALVYLARSLRVLPQNNPAAQMIFSLLTYRSWPDLRLMFQTSAQTSASTNELSGAEIQSWNEDGVLRFWDSTTGLPLNPPGRDGVAMRSAAFSPDGTRIATAALGAGIWDASNGTRLVSVLPREAVVQFIHFSPDGSKVVTDSENHSACVYDAKTGKALTQPMNHNGYIYSAVFSPDGSRVATASFDNTARVWDAGTGLPVTGPLPHKDAVHSVVFSPDGTQVLTASFDGTACVWDAQTGNKILTLAHHGPVHSAVFSLDDSRILTASSDKTAMIWDAKTGKPLLPTPISHGDIIFSAAFSPDGSRVVTASADHSARVWDARTGQAVTPPLLHDDSVMSAIFSPDGSRVLTASYDGTARMWDATTGRSLSLPMRHDGYCVYTAAFSADGSRILTMADDGIVRVWNAKIGQAYAVFPKMLSAITNQQASSSHPAINPTVPNTPSGPLSNPDALIRGLAIPASQLTTVISPDQSLKALFSGALIQVQDAKTGAVLFDLDLSRQVNKLMFSPDSSQLAVAAGDLVYLYDSRSGKMPLPALNPGNNVPSVLFNPDGSRLLTVGQDSENNQTICLWSAQNGLPLTPQLPGAFGGLGPISFSTNGLEISDDSELDQQTWDLPPADDSPEWLPDLAEAVAQHRIDDFGNVKTVPLATLNGIRTRCLASTSNGAWDQFGRWFFSGSDIRSISPWSRMSVSQYLQTCIAGYDHDTLVQAQSLAYGHPDEMAQITARLPQISPPPAPPTEFRVIYTPN